jgi:hypothetical protein
MGGDIDILDLDFNHRNVSIARQSSFNLGLHSARRNPAVLTSPFHYEKGFRWSGRHIFTAPVEVTWSGAS